MSNPAKDFFAKYGSYPVYSGQPDWDAEVGRYVQAAYDAFQEFIGLLSVETAARGYITTVVDSWYPTPGLLTLPSGTFQYTKDGISSVYSWSISHAADFSTIGSAANRIDRIWNDVKNNVADVSFTPQGYSSQAVFYDQQAAQEWMIKAGLIPPPTPAIDTSYKAVLAQAQSTTNQVPQAATTTQQSLDTTPQAVHGGTVAQSQSETAIPLWQQTFYTMAQKWVDYYNTHNLVNKQLTFDEWNWHLREATQINKLPAPEDFGIARTNPMPKISIQEYDELTGEWFKVYFAGGGGIGQGANQNASESQASANTVHFLSLFAWIVSLFNGAK
jgi:hypothetical protein